MSVIASVTLTASNRVRQTSRQGRTVRFPGSTLSWFTAIVGPFAAAALMAPAAMDGEDTANLCVSGSALILGLACCGCGMT